MAHENTTYVIVPFGDVTQAMIDVAAETSFATLRHTVSGDDKVILKWTGSTPSELSAYTQYTHSEILTELEAPEWNYYDSSSSSSSGV
jgi:hypothetical protein